VCNGPLNLHIKQINKNSTTVLISMEIIAISFRLLSHFFQVLAIYSTIIGTTNHPISCWRHTCSPGSPTKYRIFSLLSFTLLPLSYHVSYALLFFLYVCIAIFLIHCITIFFETRFCITIVLRVWDAYCKCDAFVLY